MVNTSMKSSLSRNYLFLLIALILVVGMFVTISLQPSSQRDTPIFAPDAFVSHASPGEWNARHWQWTLSFPANANPGQDVTGSTCADGQSGPVFFLPRNFPPCTLSTGKVLLVPIAGTQCTTTEPAPFSGTSEDELRDCAAREAERYTNIEVIIDGEAVPDIEAYRSTSPLFTLLLPEHNVLGAPAGLAYAVADGYQVLVKPLAPGEHDIVVHLELTDGTVLPDKFIRITVLEPTWTKPSATPAIATPMATSEEQ